MHEFDRQTDGRTDSIPIARPRLHFIQRGKKTYQNSKQNVEFQYSGLLLSETGSSNINFRPMSPLACKQWRFDDVIRK